jgi:DNA-binding response OmpR family regulator
MGRLAEGDFVLLVDDDPLALALAETSLRSAGIECRLACTFSQALEFLPRGPSAVVLDVMMPHNDSALVVEWLAQHAPRTPVIVISALPSRELTALARHWRDAGVRVAGTLPKGYARDELLAVVGARDGAAPSERGFGLGQLRRRTAVH